MFGAFAQGFGLTSAATVGFVGSIRNSPRDWLGSAFMPKKEQHAADKA